MVYAFLMQILPSHGGGNEKIKMVYSEVFGTGMNMDAPVEEQRQLREDQLVFISARVCSEFIFKKASSTSTGDETASSESKLLSSIEAGVFRLPKDKPLPVEKHVIWQAISNIGFAMVLSSEENKALAENVMNVIVQYILQMFRSADSLEEMVLNPDKIATVLHVFLPNGQILFMNHRVVKQLEKEINQILNEKK